MQQQKIPENLKEGEDTLEFLTEISERGIRKKCRYGKNCNNLCINSEVICHVRIHDEIKPALDRMKNFLAGRKDREAQIVVAAKDVISAIKAQISQQ